MKKILLVMLFLFSIPSLAALPNFSQEFQGKSGCLILYNVNKNVIEYKYNPKRCAERITSASTFKIPLSIMAFDQNIIHPTTIFIWNGKDYGRAVWNQNQTPYSWLKNSVVWVSQEITPQLGLKKIKAYLKKFNYGNQDFSGDPGKNNGLTHAWLGSSLKISADEQLNFIQNLIKNKLPVSKQAMAHTKINMYLDTLDNSYRLYGKTGSGAGNGWFVGFAEKPGQKYIIIVNLSDTVTESAGMKAREIAEDTIKNLS